MQIRQRVQGQPRFRAQLALPGLRRRHPSSDPVPRALRVDDFKNRMPVKRPPPPERDALPGERMEAVVHRDLRAGRNVGFRLISCFACLLRGAPSDTAVASAGKLKDGIWTLDAGARGAQGPGAGNRPRTS